MAARDYASARSHLEQTRADARASGDRELELRAWSIAVVVEARGGTAVDALALAEREAPATEALTPAQRSQLEYYRGLALREASRFGEAVAAFRRSLDGDPRPPVDRDAQHMLATTWLRLGELIRGRQMLRDLLPSAAAAGDRASVLTSLAWSILLEREVGDGAPVDEARALLMEALPLVGDDMDLRAHVLVNLALAAVQAAERAEAERWLAQSVATSTAPSLRTWQMDVRARLALGEGCDVARAVARDLVRYGESRLSAAATWQGWTAVARAEQRCAGAAAARPAWVEAERALTRAALDIPDDVGLLPYLRARRQSARALIALELEAGDRRAAHAVARRALQRTFLTRLHDARMASLSVASLERLRKSMRRFRVLRDQATRSVDAAAAGALTERAAAALAEARQELARGPLDPGEAPLREPLAGELFVSWLELDDGWVVLASDAQDTRAVRLGPMPARDRVRWALGALEPQLRAQRRIRLLAEPPVSDLDLAGYELDGRPLVGERVVSWAFELPPSVVRGPPRQGGVAVGVSAGIGQAALAGVIREVDAACPIPPTGCVRHVGSGSRYGPAARRAELLAALPGASWFHFAGHGDFDGQRGWSSALLLDGGDRFEVDDVLSLERAPAFAYLSACRTGSLATTAEGGAMGLAMAFLVAGADGVFAPVRDVADEVATAIAVSAHRARAADPTIDWASAVSRAQADHVHRETALAFRYFEP